MSDMEWFQFMDMHSGGGTKVDGGEYIYLKASDAIAARERFEALFGRNPENVSCETCGEDYSISCHKSLKELTEYNRRWREGRPTVADYSKGRGVIFVDPADDT